MNHLDCAVVKDLLPLYIDGLISGETQRWLDEHLQECEGCRKCLAEMSVQSQTAKQDEAETDRTLAEVLKSVEFHMLVRSIGVMVLMLVAAACYVLFPREMFGFKYLPLLLLGGCAFKVAGKFRFMAVGALAGVFCTALLLFGGDQRTGRLFSLAPVLLQVVDISVLFCLGYGMALLVCMIRSNRLGKDGIWLFSLLGCIALLSMLSGFLPRLANAKIADEYMIYYHSGAAYTREPVGLWPEDRAGIAYTGANGEQIVVSVDNVRVDCASDWETPTKALGQYIGGR